MELLQIDCGISLYLNTDLIQVLLVQLPLHLIRSLAIWPDKHACCGCRDMVRSCFCRLYAGLCAHQDPKLLHFLASEVVKEGAAEPVTSPANVLVRASATTMIW